MKQALSFHRHRSARVVWPENRTGSAKMYAVPPGSLSQQVAAPVLTLPQPMPVPLSAHATPAIAASTTAFTPTPYRFMGTASIERP